jgi:hypothetical protein
MINSIKQTAEMKGWELVEQAKREADGIVEEMADSIFFTNPENKSSYVKPTPAEPASASASAAK